jgi:ribonuclease T1
LLNLGDPGAANVTKFSKCLKAWQFLLLALLLSVNVFARELSPVGTIEFAALPPEAKHTMALIRRGGPFPYEKDGAVFGNYEGLLPKQKRGYYHEFTVKTPRARNRGARRIVTGGDMTAPREFYYTDNHYATFKRIRE